MGYETLVSNIIGPLIAAVISISSAVYIVLRQERAKLDLKQSRHLERHLRALILLLEGYEECLEKELTSSEEWKPIRPGLRSEDIDRYLWRLIRGADDPNLSTKKRDTFLRELKSITPRHFEYLRTSLKPPVPPCDFKQASDRFVFMLQRGCDLVDQALHLHGNQEEKLKNIRELKEELKELLPILRGKKRGKLLTRIKQRLLRDPDKRLPLRGIARDMLLKQKEGVANGEYGERYENHEDVYISKMADWRLQHLDERDKDRIGQRIKRLVKNPESACRMTNEFAEFYKLRLGDYRIIYGVLEDEKKIVIHAIGHWRDFYRGHDP